MRHIYKDEIIQDNECWYYAVNLYSEGDRFEIHDHDFCEIMLIERGGGRQEINGKSRMLQTGSLSMLIPGDTHSIVAGVEGLVLHNFACDIESVRTIESRYFSDNPDLLLAADSNARTWKVQGESFEQLIGLLHSLTAVSRTAFHRDLLIMTLLQILTAPSLPAVTAAMPDWLQQACSRIRRAEHLVQGTSRFFDLCGKSSEHAARELARYTGKTPSGYINELRLDRAARLLRTSGDSVLEISLACGFSNTSWFHRAFKRRFNTTPLQFRRRELYG